MSQVVSEIPLDTPVPGCPGWSIARLVKHTGIVHRWCTTIVATRATTAVPQNSVDVALPADPAGYPGWLAAGAAPLAAALRTAGPHSPAWTFAGMKDATWWARRMLHETTVHRADAELAAGRPAAIDAAVAADGISEFLDIARFGTRPGQRLAQLPAGATIHLHATGGDLPGEAGEWLISFGDDGFSWSRGHAKGTVAVRGPAALLLLLAYGRVGPGDQRLAVFGDPAPLAAWQDVMTL